PWWLARRPLPAPPRPCPTALVRYARASPRSSSPGGPPATGRPCISGPWSARPCCGRRTNNSAPSCDSARNNCSAARPKPPPPPLPPHLYLWCAPRRCHCSPGPARDSQEYLGRLGLGHDPFGQVPVLPPHLPIAGGSADPGSGPGAGHHHRWLAASAAVVRARVRGLGRAQSAAAVVARRRDPLAGVRHGRRQGGLPLVPVGCPQR